MSNLLSDRNFLNQLVWTKPIEDLALEHNVSKPMLIAKCVELQIPRPLEGYWRAVAKGAALSVSSLPPFKDRESLIPPTSLMYRQLLK